MNSAMKETGCESGGGVTSAASRPGEAFGVFSPRGFRIRPAFRHSGEVRYSCVCRNYFLGKANQESDSDEFLETDWNLKKRITNNETGAVMKRRSASSMGETKTEGKKTPPAKMLCWFGLVCVVMTAPLSVTGSDGRTIHVTVPVSSPLSLSIRPGGATALKPAAPSIKDDDAGDAVLGSSRFQFRVSGAPGQRYSIEASPNLVNWTSVSTNQVSTFGFSEFTDTAPGEFPQRFYRTRPLAGGPIVLAGGNYRNDRILVKPLAGAQLSVLHALLGTRVLHTFSAIGNLQIIQVPSGTTVDAILPLFQQSGLVQYAERDYQVQALAVPNDFRYNDGSLWGLHNTGAYGGTPGADIHAQDGWDIQNTADNIIVAVIDTGVRYTHEDLADNMWVNPDEIPGNGIDDDGDGYVDDVHGINVIANTGDPNDDHGHGTHVSGTIS